MDMFDYCSPSIRYLIWIGFYILQDTLLTETESVLRLIEDVEDREKEAEQARAAAARGGFDILEKVEEMKKMLEHAKEANEMVYICS